jgi:hypothetical protein
VCSPAELRAHLGHRIYEAATGHVKAISGEMSGGDPAYLMRMHGRSRRPGLHWKAPVLLLTLAVCRAPAEATEPDPIYLRFEILGAPGVHFMTLQAIVGYARETYTISAEAETRGLTDLLLDLRSRLEVHGKVTAVALRPDALRADTHRRGADYHTRVEYRADGGVSAELSPPPDSRVTPVTPPQMRGTIDQLTGYLALARTMATRGACTLRLKVFDGRRRYDLEFTDAPGETLPGIGTTQVCRMARYRIAGFPLDAGGSGTRDQGRVWFANLLSQGELAIPARVEFIGKLGTFIAELAELRGRGVHLRFTQ